LDKVCGSILQKTCRKYDDLSEVEKSVSVTKEVVTVKLVMQENVELALKNVVKAIDRAAGENTHSYSRNVTEETLKLYPKCNKTLLMRAEEYCCVHGNWVTHEREKMKLRRKNIKVQHCPPLEQSSLVTQMIT
jgi:hypothetical protein